MRQQMNNRLSALENRHARNFTPNPLTMNFAPAEDESAVTGLRIGEQTWTREAGESLEELEKRVIATRSDWPAVIIMEHVTHQGE